MVVHPWWQASEAVARDLVTAVEGVVVADDDVLFDARGSFAPCATTAELEARLRATFDRAHAAWLEAEERDAAKERARFEGVAAEHPESVRKANDWSDL